MKKKSFLLFGIIMMCLLCFPSIKASAAEGYIEDYETSEVLKGLTTYVVTTGEEKDLDNLTKQVIYVPTDTKEYVVPITLKHKGILYCAAYLSDDTLSGYLDIYADKDCTKSIYYSSYDGTAVIPAAGTYYLKFSVYDYSDNIEEEYYTFDFASLLYNGENRTLKNKEWAVTGIANPEKPILYKVSVTNPGVLTVNIDSEYSSYVTLLNSSKKAISKEVYASYDGEARFAVAKGTYYLEVSSYSDFIRVKSTFKAITESSGSSKSKAKIITAGKTYKGLVVATDKESKVDWYKVTLTKSQMVDITFLGSVSSGKIKLEFYGNGIRGSITEFISQLDEDASFTAMTWTSDKLPKGTYYIKVTKTSADTSGNYSIKLNK